MLDQETIKCINKIPGGSNVDHINQHKSPNKNIFHTFSCTKGSGICFQDKNNVVDARIYQISLYDLRRNIKLLGSAVDDKITMQNKA